MPHYLLMLKVPNSSDGGDLPVTIYGFVRMYVCTADDNCMGEKNK